MKKLTNLQTSGLVIVSITLVSIILSFIAINERTKIIKRYSVILNVNNVKIQTINQLSKKAYIISENVRNLMLLKDLKEIQQQRISLKNTQNAYLDDWQMILPYGVCQSNAPLVSSIMMAQKNSQETSDRILELVKNENNYEAANMLAKKLIPITKDWQNDIEECLKIEENHNVIMTREAAASDSKLEKILITLSILICPVLIILLLCFSKRELSLK